MPFQIGSKHGQSGFRDFLYDAGGSAFLKRELVGFGVVRFQ